MVVELAGSCGQQVGHQVCVATPIANATPSPSLVTGARMASVSAEVEIIEPHISKIFLAGDYAYKLKRAVTLPYLEFSTEAL